MADIFKFILNSEAILLTIPIVSVTVSCNIFAHLLCRVFLEIDDTESLAFKKRETAAPDIPNRTAVDSERQFLNQGSSEETTEARYICEFGLRL